MSEMRKLAYRDRYVKYLLQTLSDRFDDEPQFPTLPFSDLTSRVPLVYRVNNREYTQILSAIMTGADLAFPDIAHELELIWTYPDLFEPEEDTCLDYQTDDTSIITFEPQDPHTEPDLVPPGYLMPPFWRVGGLVPEFLPDWFAELITDIIEQFTGYEDDDILTTVGSFPLLGNWDTILTEGLPRFTIIVEGKGTLQLHLLSVPLGGRLLVSIDIEFNPIDIIEGIINEGFKLIELERDYSSSPPELDVDHIEEIELTTSGTHTIYCTFLPVLDIDAIPIKFGGGIRKVTWCPDEILDPDPCADCPPEQAIEVVLNDETFFQEVYIPQTFGELYTETNSHNEALETVYDGTPQSIGEDIPTGTPNVIQKNALCYAVHSFVGLYASSKLCIIQSKNFLEIAWTELMNAINAVYNALANSMAFIYTPNLYSCFVDDAEAITALQDTSAIEDLACFIYDELKTVTISQTNFDTAILDAATTLTGNAQKIACLMQNDSNLTVYINFLEAYQIALNRINNGEDLECPCEEETTYWLKVYDFRISPQGWSNVGATDGTLCEHTVGVGWHNKINVATTSNYSIRLPEIDGKQWNIKATGRHESRTGSGGNGTHDFSRTGLHADIYWSGTNTNLGDISFIAVDGADLYFGGIEGASVKLASSLGLRGRLSADDTAVKIILKRVVYWGVPNAFGEKPLGAVWAGTTLPATVEELFP